MFFSSAISGSSKATDNSSSCSFWDHIRSKVFRVLWEKTLLNQSCLILKVMKYGDLKMTLRSSEVTDNLLALALFSKHLNKNERKVKVENMIYFEILVKTSSNFGGHELDFFLKFTFSRVNDKHYLFNFKLLEVMKLS